MGRDEIEAMVEGLERFDVEYTTRGKLTGSELITIKEATRMLRRHQPVATPR